MIRYLYLDDTIDSSTQAIVHGLTSASADLRIDLQFPAPFEAQIETLKDENLDGLILDLRLDQRSGPNHPRVSYRGFSLAQEVRTRATEQALIGFPICLLTSNTKLNASFVSDDTSHDLFDAVYLKEHVHGGETRIARELVSLARGYREIRETLKSDKGKLSELLNLADGSSGWVDTRVLNHFAGSKGKVPPHEYARFIIQDLIEMSGPLIDEEVLAARLGIDIQKSPQWTDCKAMLPSEITYAGVFHDGWPRWWASLLERWWSGLDNSPGPLTSLSAETRVNFLKTSTNLTALTAARPIRGARSTCYWVVCEGTRRPLDPVDGLLIYEKNSQPWHQRRYVSAREALERENVERWKKLNPLEESRLKALKKTAKK